uniref:RING-type domain-containing protein n=1 Tax=Pseudo-nitzschia australis TaxID=44445 RepID=A0A7S4AVL3_9STRA|mmetsp:Transcript_836/g.1930  ORF Transcript_836/g.1930 Transcript_836/m.1930 type:complete len:557 (-) Transcript_836:118-1788(-)
MTAQSTLDNSPVPQVVALAIPDDDSSVPEVSVSGIPDNDYPIQDTFNRSSLRSSQQTIQTSLAALVEDCFICLNGMKDVDAKHVLQCERHCGFNMCKNCIDSLITSSKDDFQMASDGNMHVKVYLHCPNCRSDLSHSIRHTLLLRKVDELECMTSPESEWTSSQVRLKRALHTTEVQKAIIHARRMESEYFGRDFHDSFFQYDSETDSQVEQYIEQWGVEVDLTNGTHNSFIAPRPPAIDIREEAIRVDPTLFAGLDSFLTEDERKEVTKLMTGGKPYLLVEAANILYDTLQKLSNPEPSTSGNNLPKVRTGRRMSIARRSSVFQLIDDAKIAESRKDKEEQKVAEEMHALQNPRSRVAQHRQLERELRIQANFQKHFPIPVRMPKAVKLDLSLSFDMELVDYTWGGTVMDAYSKISIGFGTKIIQQRPNNINVESILGNKQSYVESAALGCAIGLCMISDEDYGDANDVYIALPGQARVVISCTGRIGKLGAVRGDVLTHVDGESVVNKKVTEVLDIIQAKKGQGFTMLTLNAEFSVADALKRRAIAISEIELSG